MTASSDLTQPTERDWEPELVEYPPVFVWPARPLEVLRFLPDYLKYNAPFLALAVLAWWLTTPSLEDMSTLEVGWVATILGRNALMVVVLYGGAHWLLYRTRAQGDSYKFNSRWPPPKGRGRTFGNQTRENVFWALASGVTIWTAWEVTTLWLQANGRIPTMTWASNPIWFLALFPIVLLFREIHFYAIHRLIHWRPLYKRVHSLHHRNVNVSPWSGLSMHPVEHLLYFSALAVHWFGTFHDGSPEADEQLRQSMKARSAGR